MLMLAIIIVIIKITIALSIKQSHGRRHSSVRSAIPVQPQSMGICEMRKHKDSGEGGKLAS